MSKIRIYIVLAIAALAFATEGKAENRNQATQLDVLMITRKLEEIRNFSMLSHFPCPEVGGAPLKSHMFIYTIAPIAMHLQRELKLPASMLIAQASLESGFGSSGVAKKKNNLFGIACPKSASAKTLKFNLALSDGTHEIPGKCAPASKGGTEMVHFDSAEDSVLAYASILAQSPNTATHYEALRKAIKSIPETVPQRWRHFIESLDKYSETSDYSKRLSTLIGRYRLDKYDQAAREHRP